MIGASLEAVSRARLYDDDDSDYSDSQGSVFSDDDDEEENLPEEGSSSLRRHQQDKKERQVISASRTFALFFLCLTAVTVGHVVYFFVVEDEHDDFRNSYFFLSFEVAKSFDTRAEMILSGLETLATLAPLVAATNGEVLPFFTSEEWLAEAAEVQTSAHLETVFFTPELEGVQELNVWEFYAMEHQYWLQREDDENSTLSSYVWAYDGNMTVPASDLGHSVFSPYWQSSPVPENTTIVNLDLASIDELGLHNSSDLMPSISEFVAVDQEENSSSVWEFFAWGNETNGPRSFFFFPIKTAQGLIGHVGGIVLWEDVLDNLVAEGNVMVVMDLCSTLASFEITHQATQFIGYGDLHNTGFDSMEVVHGFGEDPAVSGCTPTLSIYPTSELENQYSSRDPVLTTFLVGLMFGLSIFLFILYDKNVRRRQAKVEKDALQSEAIVSQLFPGRIREMVIKEDASENGVDANGGITKDAISTLAQADFFPDVTLMFADLVGFTAWSSLREPQQVFQLLEAVFSAFDEIARKRSIFKVETVGDCYVAAVGLPNYRKDHAVAMARFARDCLLSLKETLSALTASLGHDTLELGLRVGIHSGPVTAGVLRGERARFQLFGDTMNTCARLESTCVPNRIQISEQTAQLLSEAGKESWFQRREDAVEAKGKGLMKTFWLKVRHRSGSQHSGSIVSSSTLSNSSESDEPSDHLEVIETDKNGKLEEQEEEKKTKALIDWNVETLASLLKPVIAQREKGSFRSSNTSLMARMAESVGESGGMVVDEVAETIRLPEFDAQNAVTSKAVEDTTLSDAVLEELRQYVAVVASMYRKNAFHNFEHATNVALAMRKLLSRIVAPKMDSSITDQGATMEARKHDHTYGITSDPLTQFAVVFSALIHDVDHRGISNGLLAKEEPSLAAAYKSKSIAEQNSVDVAWYALMSSDFTNLRSAIFANLTELKRFRQLLVNAVIATDIFDKDQGALRKKRWAKAFSASEDEAKQEDINRKATIVIEHLIQASDVSHTMAHWAIYQKWNEKLFKEQHDAYISGRSDTDPSKGWYKGELWFFDNYIIPLTTKLKSCGVFGVSSDEYLKYAEANRREWALRGESIVAEWTKKYSNVEK